MLQPAADLSGQVVGDVEVGFGKSGGQVIFYGFGKAGAVE